MKTFLSCPPSVVRRAQVWALVGASALLPLQAMLANDAKSGEKSLSLTEFSKDADDKLGWQVVDDGVMGGLSKGNMSLTKDGAARFEGTLTLENNGGFSSIRTSGMEPMDLSRMTGLRPRVKGDGRTYQVRPESDARWGGIRTVSFKADFATKKDEWVEVEVPFSAFTGGWRGRDLPDMKLNTATIERIGLILADKNSGKFALEVDWIHAYGGQDHSDRS